MPDFLDSRYRWEIYAKWNEDDNVALIIIDLIDYRPENEKQNKNRGDNMYWNQQKIEQNHVHEFKKKLINNNKYEYEFAWEMLHELWNSITSLDDGYSLMSGHLKKEKF